MPVKYQLSLKEGSTPPSTDAPTALDELLTQIRQYTEVATNSDDPDSDKVRSILVQPTEPTGANANDLWVQVHATSGRPLALKAYTGSEWRPVNVTNSGDSNSRPGDAVAGETYFDTDINVMLMYTGSAWVTQDGSPGDIKFVYLDNSLYTGGAGYTEAVRLNPGWEAFSAVKGHSLVAVDDTDAEDFGGTEKYKAAGYTFGTKTHPLTEDELAAHTHTVPVESQVGKAGSTGGDAFYNASATTETGSTGSGDAHENRPPSYTAFCIRKLGYET
jgi:hypothetical protein